MEYMKGFIVIFAVLAHFSIFQLISKANQFWRSLLNLYPEQKWVFKMYVKATGQRSEHLTGPHEDEGILTKFLICFDINQSFLEFLCKPILVFIDFALSAP